jgi:myosin heavy subunit
LNYFSYFSEIEDTFIRRRGKHLWLSPIDWALMESWKERGVPLHVALRGIEHAFDSHAAKKYKRSVKTLLYCEEEVEAQYAEWLESRVGSHDEKEKREAESADRESPFPRQAVLEHLERALDQLNQQRKKTSKAELAEVLSRAAKLLSEIKDDYESALQPDARKLEESLTGIERLLNDALRASVSADQSAEIQKEIRQQLRPYRAHMEKAVYQQTFANLLLKRLRELFGVPRLSLFYL